MKHLNTYKIFEEDAYYSAMTSGRRFKNLYRTTVYEWLLNLLKKSSVAPPKGTKYLSFSWDPNSGQGDSDEFGDIRIDFDSNEIFKQGGIELEYSPIFFEKNPAICHYVTGFKNEKEYNKWAVGRKNELSWIEFIRTFSGEKEVILDKLKMNSNLIKKVTIWDADERDNLQEIKDTLKKYKLNVDVPWEK